MAKAKIDAPTEASNTGATSEIVQSLDEFCRRLSVTERRYGLIAAFHFREKEAGHVRDLPSAYAKRYAAYIDPTAIEGDK
ncbi:hypothetical protein ACLMYS_003872 [Salmonella enterica]|nr:hypothetical protein [Salmonella enterica subsp. enterica serovar Typhimurium]